LYWHVNNFSYSGEKWIKSSTIGVFGYGILASAGLARPKGIEWAEKFITKHNLKNPEEIRAAAIKFVLSNPNVNTACCSLQTYEEMERILPLSGKKLTHT